MALLYRGTIPPQQPLPLAQQAPVQATLRTAHDPALQ
jgi:hypothetical protein